MAVHILEITYTRKATPSRRRRIRWEVGQIGGLQSEFEYQAHMKAIYLSSLPGVAKVRYVRRLDLPVLEISKHRIRHLEHSTLTPRRKA